jgi:hypothetical protein
MSTSPGASVPATGEEAGPPVAAGRPVLDVLAVLAAMQQQLDDLREVVQAQQTTLQSLLGTSPRRTARAAVGGSTGGR